VVEDGYGSYRRKVRFHRATHGLSRLIIIGHSGCGASAWDSVTSAWHSVTLKATYSPSLTIAQSIAPNLKLVLRLRDRAIVNEAILPELVRRDFGFEVAIYELRVRVGADEHGGEEAIAIASEDPVMRVLAASLRDRMAAHRAVHGEAVSAAAVQASMQDTIQPPKRYSWRRTPLPSGWSQRFNVFDALDGPKTSRRPRTTEQVGALVEDPGWASRRHRRLVRSNRRPSMWLSELSRRERSEQASEFLAAVGGVWRGRGFLTEPTPSISAPTPTAVMVYSADSASAPDANWWLRLPTGHLAPYLDLTRFGGHPNTWGMTPREGSPYGREDTASVSA
jgi:hypothetical protein